MTPRHVAVIMDGNGRWAAKRLLPKTAGHKAGAQALKKLAPEVERLGIKHLTVYAFSTENWNRPADEVDGLMKLLREYIRQYIEDSEKNEMRINVIGDEARLDRDLRDGIAELTELTKNKQGLCVNIALNYGGRDEITRAAKKLAGRVAAGELAIGDIDEEKFASSLDTAGTPDPELLIKTGGEMRLSNFLLWQLAYSEIYVLDKYWPDFEINDFNRALEWFNGRERRFGSRP
ncbi:MAG: isoprenyl transferase [Defluviitaleaceae bacterium]|nr:isoprenyl transferase [Defluviitaleaceae bacterium]